MSFRNTATLLCLLTVGTVHAQNICDVRLDRLFADGYEDSILNLNSPAGSSGPGLTRPLNDSGTVVCADEDSYGLECPVGTAPCQDAEYGRDLLDEAGFLPKVGDGDAGFDYTKLDAAGNELPADAASWRCTRDNHTGLVWTVKQTDGSIYDANQLFSWYNPDNSVNGNDPGGEDGGLCTDTNLDTLDLVDQATDDQLCGRTDWRLPDMPDLNSLFHFGAHRPAIDTGYFPNTGVEDNYYSNTTAMYTTGGGNAWCSDMKFVTSGVCQKAGFFCRQARVVAGEPFTSPPVGSTCSSQKVLSTTPTSDFEVQPDSSTVLHKPTGLIWKRCVEGLTWDGTECTGSDEGYDWQEALAAADAQDGWRVPNVRELLSIVEYCTAFEASNSDIFPMSLVDSVWTSTPVYTSSIQAWQVDFFRGRPDKAPKSDNGVPVLLVKDADL